MLFSEGFGLLLGEAALGQALDEASKAMAAVMPEP